MAQFLLPADLRRAVRLGEFVAPTAGECPGYVQTNVVIVPATVADDFARFCELNPRPCPLVARTPPGVAEPAAAAPGADLRSDVPRYRVFRHGRAESVDPTAIHDLWRDDFVGFLIGCSFTFEHALVAAGLKVRHLEERRNVPMFRTNIPCASAGPFAGPLVVSMRPFQRDEVEQVTAISGRFPRMHGAPIHVGDPAAIGIPDLSQPDFGQSVTIRAGDVPVFWACGVTPQLALEQARLELAITHSPGLMFVTDLRDEEYCER